jgi:hypothetical protein
MQRVTGVGVDLEHGRRNGGCQPLLLVQCQWVAIAALHQRLCADAAEFGGWMIRRREALVEQRPPHPGRQLQALGDDRRLALLNEFAGKYHQLTDADAESLLSRLWQSEQDSLRIRQRYARKVQQILPGVKALRYVQLQARIENALAGKFISLVPLAH